MKTFYPSFNNFLKLQYIYRKRQVTMARKYKWMGDKFVEKDVLDGMEGGDINSREDLMRIAEEEGLVDPIRWDRWQASVDQAKALIEALGDLPPVSLKKECYVYSTKTGEFIGHYSSLREAAEATGVAEGTVHHCCWKKVPLQRMELAFSYYPLTWKEVCQKANHKPNNYTAGKPKERWVYRESDCKFLGHYNSSEEVAKAFGIRRDAVNYTVFRDKPYHKYNLIIKDRPMEDNEGRA